MGSKNHVLVLQRGIRTGQLADDVLRVDRPDLLLDVERRFQPERHRLEVARRRLGFQRLIVLAGHLRRRGGRFDRHPALHFGLGQILVGRDEAEPLAAESLDDVERIARAVGLVNDDGRGRAQFSRLVVLVSPAAVVRHGAAAEDLWIERLGIRRVGNRRVVDEHDDRLALYVDAFVVVPLELGRLHAVADEDDVGVVERDGVGHLPAERHELVAYFEGLGGSALLDHQRARKLRRQPDKRNLLCPGPVGVAWLEPRGLEALGQKRNGEFLALRSRQAAPEFIGRHPGDVAEHRGGLPVWAVGHRHLTLGRG